MCPLCVAFQRINGFEAVYAAGALCGVTPPYRRSMVWCSPLSDVFRLEPVLTQLNCFITFSRHFLKGYCNFEHFLRCVIYFRSSRSTFTTNTFVLSFFNTILIIHRMLTKLRQIEKGIQYVNVALLWTLS